MSATKYLFDARPSRTDGFVIPYDAAGCRASRSLRLRGLTTGPPMLGRGRRAFLGATYDDGVALVKIHR